jgi:hypothetical protein
VLSQFKTASVGGVIAWYFKGCGARSDNTSAVCIANDSGRRIVPHVRYYPLESYIFMSLVLFTSSSNLSRRNLCLGSSGEEFSDIQGNMSSYILGICLTRSSCIANKSP